MRDDITLVTAPIGPGSGLDPWPTHRAIWGHGGYRTVDDLMARDGIPAPRRESGMIAYVREDRSTWRLNEDLITWDRLDEGCCILLEWAILDVDGVSVSDLDGVLLLEPGEEDYPFVYRHGDTMTGPLILSEEPEPGVDPPLQAAPYQWVLDQLGQFEGASEIVEETLAFTTFDTERKSASTTVPLNGLPADASLYVDGVKVASGLVRESSPVDRFVFYIGAGVEFLQARAIIVRQQA